MRIVNLEVLRVGADERIDGEDQGHPGAGHQRLQLPVHQTILAVTDLYTFRPWILTSCLKALLFNF